MSFLPSALCVLSHFSCVWLCDSMDYSPPAPLSMGFSRQEYWSGLPCPSPGDLPNPGIKPESLTVSWIFFLSFFFFFFFTVFTFIFIYLFILFVVNFVIHWNETAIGLHMFPIPIPPPTSLSTQSLWVFPVHQVSALVSCIQPGLVICFTLDNIHVSMLFSWTIPPSPSPTESKRLFYKSVSFFFLFCI